MRYQIGSDEQISMAIVRAMSAIDGRPPEELPPLGRYLDPDALDAVFDTGSDSSSPGGQLSFTYNEHRVTLVNGEYLELSPIMTGRESGAVRSQSTR